MAAAKQKYILLSDEETAKILSININKLYKICGFFDGNEDDEWDLIEGEHFEWVKKNVGKRKFYEAGAVAIAKYLQEIESKGFLAGLIENVREAFTHRRKKIRRHLVTRQVNIEFSSLDDVRIVNDLIFLERPKVIRILGTNGKGINASVKRIQENDSLEGQQQLEPDKHFKTVENSQYWSQVGIAGIAQDMSQNHERRSRYSRKAWTDAVFEEIENAIRERKKYLESFKIRVDKAKVNAKTLAGNRCQVSLRKSTPAKPFDLHAHHLFDQASRPDLADVLENLLVMHADVHRGFHQWHGSESCEPQDFIEYLLHAEGAIFESKKNTQHLNILIHNLERIQARFEDCYRMP